MAEPSPADWYPDPFGRYELRFWDGAAWTERVATEEQQTVDAPIPPKIFTLQSLVIRKKIRLGSKVEYTVQDEHGNRIGAADELGRSASKKLMERISGMGGNTRGYSLQMTDSEGHVLLTVVRPEVNTWPRLAVFDTGGSPIGEILLERFGGVGGLASFVHGHLSGLTSRLDAAIDGWDKIGHVRFAIKVDGETLATLVSENADDTDFSIQNSYGAELARLKRTGRSIVAGEKSQRDRYFIELCQDLDERLRPLIIVTPVAIDTALRQGAARLSGG